MLNSLFAETRQEEALENLLNFIAAFYKSCGQDYDVNQDKALIGHVLASTRYALSKLRNPSVFKKAAVFTHHFVFTSPITKELPPILYPAEVNRRWYHNATVAFAASMASLEGAVIHCAKGDKEIRNPVDISIHQHRDFMVALSQVDKLDDVYSRFIALIYETLVYEFNDGARYHPDDES